MSEEKRKAWFAHRKQQRQRFEIFKGEKDWYWHLIDGNNEIIAQSEGYSSQGHALRGAKNVKDTAKHARFVLTGSPPPDPRG